MKVSIRVSFTFYIFSMLVCDFHFQGHCSKVIYSVKWATSGLAPVRPQVVLTSDLELPPGRTVALF